MSTVSKNTAEKKSGLTAPENVSIGVTIKADTYQQMLSILEDLTDHTHTVYDDYTANCNCNCNCSRGIL